MVSNTLCQILVCLYILVAWGNPKEKSGIVWSGNLAGHGKSPLCEVNRHGKSSHMIYMNIFAVLCKTMFFKLQDIVQLQWYNN